MIIIQELVGLTRCSDEDGDERCSWLAAYGTLSGAQIGKATLADDMTT